MNTETPTKKVKKVWSAKIDQELLNKAKGVAYWTPGLTLSSLVETAVRAYLEAWEREHGPAQLPGGPLREGKPLIIRKLP